jgi:hypothetical protein
LIEKDNFFSDLLRLNNFFGIYIDLLKLIKI